MLTEKAVSNIFKYTLSFDDLLLVPKYSDIESRKEVDLTTALGAKSYSLPIVSSPMDTVTEDSMALAMANAGGLGVIHRYNTIREQAEIVKRMHSAGREEREISVAIGVSGDFLERALVATSEGAGVICVDIAHGHHSLMERALKTLKDKLPPEVTLIAGNIAMPDGYIELSRWGADGVRVGIGGGSICSTRLQTGHGVPTLQSVMACHIARGLNRDVNVTPAAIIADGGIRTNGDIVKSLAAGADFAMLGSLLAGTSESPGTVFHDAGEKKYKVYRGMASPEAQEDWRGFASSLEGVSTTIPYKGSVELILRDMTSSLKSGLSYSGARNLSELRSKCEFVIQTSAGQSESGTHIMRSK